MIVVNSKRDLEGTSFAEVLGPQVCRTLALPKRTGEPVPRASFRGIQLAGYTEKTLKTAEAAIIVLFCPGVATRNRVERMARAKVVVSIEQHPLHAPNQATKRWFEEHAPQLIPPKPI